MTTKLYNVRFETEGADLFVELEAEAELNRQHLLERVVAILEDRHGIETIDSTQGEITRVDHSDGSTLRAWLSISGQSAPGRLWMTTALMKSSPVLCSCCSHRLWKPAL